MINKNLWEEYFESQDEKDKFVKRITAKENIIAAYIRTKNENMFNYEINNRLLFQFEKNNLENNENSRLINEVKNKLTTFFQSYESFEAKLILKIKDIENKEYRPICIMDLIDEIALNCFLNIFIEEISDKVKFSWRQFGNSTPLLKYCDDNERPINNEVTDLYFNRWQKSYSDYNKFIMEQLEKEEIVVYITDIKNFFTSISLINFFNLLEETYNCEYMKIFRLAFRIKIVNMNWYEFLDTEESIKQYGISKFNEKYYITSLPQGLLFSPIFANIYLSDIKSLNLNCAVYVDDIHLFSKKENYMRDVELLLEYFKKKGLKINSDKTTILEKIEAQDYRRLIESYGTNVSILRAHTNKKEIDIEEEKYILNNFNDIKVFLEEKIKTFDKKEKNNIYAKYLEKVKKMKDYREIRNYTYKSKNFSDFQKIFKLLENILHYLDEKINISKEDINNSEGVFYELGAYNANLYDITEYTEKLLKIFKNCHNSYLNNIMFRFLNRNINHNSYEKFQKISNNKYDILFKEEFYQFRSKIDENKIISSLDNAFINISFLKYEVKNDAKIKEYISNLFKKIREEYYNKNYNINWENIFYKIEYGKIIFKFVNINNEIKEIVDYTNIFPERIIINKLTELISILLPEKGINDYKVWEYRLYIVSQSYHQEFIEYLNLIILILEDESDFCFEYIEQDLLDILENNYIPKMWKENANYIDCILKLYLLVRKMWENGSKNLYFYTAHNCEHTKELIKNFEKFIIGQCWKLKLTQEEILYMYVAFILHDIGMLYIEDSSILNVNTTKLRSKIFDYANELNLSDYVNDNKVIKKRFERIKKIKKSPINKKHKKRKFIHKSEKESNQLYDFYENFIENYTRELHGLFSLKIIEEDKLKFKEIVDKMNLNIKILYVLILGHTDLDNKLQYKIYEKIDIEKLVEIIKLIDLTDITSSRINDEFYKVFEDKLSKRTKEEYNKHRAIKKLEINNEKLEEDIIEFIYESESITPKVLENQVSRYNKYMKNKGISMKVECKKYNN